MPMNKQQLASAFIKIFSSGGSTRQQARDIAKAYSDYAQNATSPSPGTVNPAMKAVKMNVLAAALIVAFNSKSGTSTAKSMGNAFSAFWMGTTFIATPPGIVTAAIPVSLIKSFISSANKKDNTRQAAHKLANNLHKWALSSVIVTHAPVPPGPVGPVS